MTRERLLYMNCDIVYLKIEWKLTISLWFTHDTYEKALVFSLMCSKSAFMGFIEKTLRILLSLHLFTLN